jgi:DNA-binding MarR family transcriptional regulator
LKSEFARSTSLQLSEESYSDWALEVFNLIEAFTTEVLPLLWKRESTVQQAQITTVILTRQLKGKKVYASALAKELDLPRSTIQHSIEKLMDQGRLESKVDPDDARQRILRIPRSHAAEIGAFETLMVEFCFTWFQVFREISESTSREQQAAAEFDELKRKLKELTESFS